MSRAIETRILVLSCAVALLPGCFASHLCGTPELCNYADDDCDGLIDEDFVTRDGRYVRADHCGGCGVSCANVFPSARSTMCDERAVEPVCVLVDCFPGEHDVGGACLPEVTSLCAPCVSDVDCSRFETGAVCVTEPSGSRCASPCRDASCPRGFSCDPLRRACVPQSGRCGCSDMTIGTSFGCILERGPTRCAGTMACTERGLGACTAALVERCNEQDDDCDGSVDEDFRGPTGAYTAALHCGGCNAPCVPPGPNMVATCVPSGMLASCRITCVDGFVDVDEIPANGCECQRWDGEGPPPDVGGDFNCDGVIDVTNDFIYVTSAGSDTNPGTREQPMRTLNAAIARASTERKDVLVARGIYEGPVDVVGGVSMWGGYRPDFRDRDIELFPVAIESRVPGSAVLRCRGVTASTTIDGVTITGSDATVAGGSSIAVQFDGCGAAVVLSNTLIVAGAAADGARGASASDRVRDFGITSLVELDGTNGVDGADGNSRGEACFSPSAGEGGAHSCRRTNVVSGGRGGNGSCNEPDICRSGEPCANAGCTDFTVGGVCDFDRVRALAVAQPVPLNGRGSAPGNGGEASYNAPTNRGICRFCDDNPTLPREGADGTPGGAGRDGTGGRGCSSLVTIDLSSGLVVGGPGGDGTDGTDGSGGGGGSAGSGYDVIEGVGGPGECVDQSGGAGGGGGSGGCGAPSGLGGTGGGGSIGVVVRVAGATGPTFDRVRIVAANGGDGGDGGLGATGGAPGIGAPGGTGAHWCTRSGGRGGDGGRGGAGGGGGGGCGGPSHGVMVVGPNAAMGYVAAIAGDIAVELAGVAGRGGRGGFSPGASGADGTAGSGEAIRLEVR